MLTSPIGSDLTDRELRALELEFALPVATLARGIRTGPLSVTVTTRTPPLHQIKVSVTI